MDPFGHDKLVDWVQAEFHDLVHLAVSIPGQDFDPELEDGNDLVQAGQGSRGKQPQEDQGMMDEVREGGRGDFVAAIGRLSDGDQPLGAFVKGKLAVVPGCVVLRLALASSGGRPLGGRQLCAR